MPGRIYLWGLTVCIVLCVHFGKAEVAYRCPTSTDFKTIASHEAGVVYFTEYLSVLFQLTYLDELYGERNGTARACVNSGYQALFSPITEHLGMRLGKLIESQPCIHRKFARLRDRRDLKGIVVRTLDFVILSQNPVCGQQYPPPPPPPPPPTQPIL